MLAAVEHVPAVTVRIADLRDEEQLIAMCRSLHEENALRNRDGKPLPIDEQKVRHTVQRAIIPNRNEDGLQSWIGVIGDPGCLQGSIYLTTTMLWYSNQTVVEELWNYCLPEYRQSNNARALVDFAKSSADAMGATLVMGVMNAGSEGEKARFYRRQLGSPVGSYFAYQGNPDRKARGTF